MVDVEVVVARGSRGLELGELLLSVVLSACWRRCRISEGEDALKSLGEDAKGDGEIVERLLVLSSRPSRSCW